MSAITEREQRRDEEPENETVLRDLELLDDQAEGVVGGYRDLAYGSGGCPELACGSGGNHNEILAVAEDRDEEPEHEPVLGDLELRDREAEGVAGGRPPTGDTYGTNHNEVLAVTA